MAPLRNPRVFTLDSQSWVLVLRRVSLSICRVNVFDKCRFSDTISGNGTHFLRSFGRICFAPSTFIHHWVYLPANYGQTTLPGVQLPKYFSPACHSTLLWCNVIFYLCFFVGSDNLPGVDIPKKSEYRNLTEYNYSARK